MDNITLIESFADFKDDKLIDRVTLMAILEEVFRGALRRKYGDDENFDVIINPDKGDLEIWRNRIVVEDGKVEDENLEIEKRNIADQQKEVMAEAKSRGYDTKIMRKLVVLRKRDLQDLAEEEAILSMYKSALGM